jgi:hypothetical protein
MHVAVVEPRHDDLDQPSCLQKQSTNRGAASIPQHWCCQTLINKRSKMVGLSKLPNSSYASSIDEAQTLVRRCAEPRPAGDQVKAAVRRASQRLGIPFSRVRDIWYGDARRIDADEMDKLRQEAEKAELAQAVAAIEFLKNKFLAAPSSAPHQVITSLRAALLACHRDTVGNLPVSLSDKHPKPNLELRLHRRVLTLGAGDRCRGASTTGLLLEMMMAPAAPD